MREGMCGMWCKVVCQALWFVHYNAVVCPTCHGSDVHCTAPPLVAPFRPSQLVQQELGSA
jgi:hypothetical protein